MTRGLAARLASRQAISAISQPSPCLPPLLLTFHGICGYINELIGAPPVPHSALKHFLGLQDPGFLEDVVDLLLSRVTCVFPLCTKAAVHPDLFLVQIGLLSEVDLIDGKILG